MNAIGPIVEWKVEENYPGNYALFVRFSPNGDGYWWAIKSWKHIPADSDLNATKDIAMSAFRVFGKNISINQDAFFVDWMEEFNGRVITSEECEK